MQISGISGRSLYGGINTALSIEDSQRRTKSLSSEGGGGGRVPRLKVKKSDRAQRKRKRRFREMGICLELHSGIDHGLSCEGSFGGISTPEVLTALESEPMWYKNIEYY